MGHPGGAAITERVRRATCRVYIGDVFKGTASVCLVYGRGPCLLTCNHVVRTREEALKAKIRFTTIVASKTKDDRFTTIVASKTKGDTHECTLDPRRLFACCAHPLSPTARGQVTLNLNPNPYPQSFTLT